MLPPQLRSGTAVSRYRASSSNALSASSTSTLRHPTAHTQTRNFWNGRHRWDWASQLDPTYWRYNRVRTLRTRAKLLSKLRRRGAFEWDSSTKPFFTPRNLRWASHWRGRQWYTNDDPRQNLQDEAVAKEERPSEEDGYELSQREKEWKEQMEAMRKRIAQDPYEAIFGKRFEPFYSPLVPSWMREEMGLQGWPKEKPKEAGPMGLKGKVEATIRHVEGREAQEPSVPASSSRSKTQDQSKQHAQSSSTVTNPGSVKTPLEHAKPFSRMTRQERVRHAMASTSAQQSAEQANPSSSSPTQAYAYASSTSWDSVSNKVRAAKWDSESNQTKRFEYDPISNRMIEIEATEKVAIDSDSSATRHPISNASSQAASANGESSDANKPIHIPIKQSNDVRKSIPIPPPLSQPSHSITLGYVQTSAGVLKNTAVSSTAVKPAALAKLPAKDLDMLTADNVRASMGKVKQPELIRATTAEEKAKLERDFDTNSRMQDVEVDAILKERAATKESMNVGSSWDQAEMVDILEREVDRLQQKKEKLVKDEKGLFHIERQKRELQKLDESIKAVTKRVDATNLAMIECARPSALQNSLQRAEPRKASRLLQSSIERMQSKTLPKAVEQDLDDAAAHESTEPIEKPTSVPKEWAKQADILQIDRVKRTASKRPYLATRWIDDMNARKVAFEHRKAEAQAAEDARNADNKAKLDKLNKLLQAEISEQKFNMQAFEGRYSQKVKSMRGELDNAFKQSSVHSEKHVERIRELEAQLHVRKEKEEKYAEKVKSLRGELERAYKQSAVHADEHVERIRYLEGELETATRTSVGVEQPKAQALPAEGDLCVNAPSFGENGKWYKRQANPSRPTTAQIETAEQRARDQALVDEVKGIYESQYGIIDENHEQPKTEMEDPTAVEEPSIQRRSPHPDRRPVKQNRAERRAANRTPCAEGSPRQVVEVESDVDLGEELEKYEKERPQTYKVQNHLAPDISKDTGSIIAESLQKELGIPKSATREAVATSIHWADPPLYKVLAYDSGNDMMSTATTTTSVLPGSAEERPLGIPEALSQLYQPARFVPYFAELQSENFQAIAATREVIVFRQVKKAKDAAKKNDKYERSAAGLEDHGLAGLQETAEKEISKEHRNPNRINPIDGMSRLHLKPTTGNFASPTGFVNHDPVFPPEPKQEESASSIDEPKHEASSDTYSTIAKEPTAKTSREIWESLPGSNEAPVRRTETVFSGMTKKQRKRAERELQQQLQREDRERKQREQEDFNRGYREAEQRGDGRRTRGGKALKYTLGAGLGTAGTMYLVGALAEKERSMEYQTERAMREKVRKWEMEKQRLEREAERLAREWEKR